MTRREELEAGMPAPQVIIKLKTGVKRDGTLLALEGETVIESGAYSGAVLTMSGVFLASVYQWPNFEVRGFEVLTHKPSIAAYRAPMAPQTVFAIDSHMEQIARALGLDPVEFRLRHLMQDGDLMANGQPWQSNGATQVPGAASPSTRSGRTARSGRPAAARTAAACAAPAWRSAAGCPACSRPAPRCG